MGLLQSALAMPSAEFAGEFLHDDLFHMAAAYLYHIALNHPFVDGNKRVASMAADVFLAMNGLTLLASCEVVYEKLTLNVSQGGIEKLVIANFFKKHSRKNKK